MPLIITPRQLNQRAELYHQLGIMITAGLSVRKALEQLQSHPPSKDMRGPITKWIEQLDQGHTVSGSLLRIGKWIPSFDLALLDAGERSGPARCLLQTPGGLLPRARTNGAADDFGHGVSRLRSAHCHPSLSTDRSFYEGNITRFLCMTVGIAVPLYAVVFLVIYACQGRHGELWRSRMENILGRIPLLGTARQYLALARLATALESLLNAGVPIVTAWELASTASGSPALARTVQTWKEPLENGSTFSELISKSGRFPDLFANLYHTGEVSGTLDETLTRLHTLYQSEGLSRMKALSQWTPKLVYFGILFFVAWKIITFYTGYFHQIDDIKM